MRLTTHAERVDALCGKYAFTHTCSDDLISRKRSELDHEAGKPFSSMTRAERVRALKGQFAFVPTSSDEFNARKAAEIRKEDRNCPPS